MLSPSTRGALVSVGPENKEAVPQKKFENDRYHSSAALDLPVVGLLHVVASFEARVRRIQIL